MKLIELFEKSSSDWSIAKAYTPNKIQNDFTDDNAASFLRGVFSDELKKLLSFLQAWETVARQDDASFQFKRAKKAKEYASTLISAFEPDAVIETLAQANIVTIVGKLKDSSVIFNAVAEKFSAINEDKLSAGCAHLSKLLQLAAEEASSNKNKSVNPSPKMTPDSKEKPRWMSWN